MVLIDPSVFYFSRNRYLLPALYVGVLLSVARPKGTVDAVLGDHGEGGNKRRNDATTQQRRNDATTQRRTCGVSDA